jgi:hypothetical protein
MFRRFPLLTIVIAAGLGLAIGSFNLSAQDTDKRGRKFKAPPATARVEITILRDFNSKPIENAAVVFHPMEGERDKGNMELKTNEDGKTVIDVLPMGDTVRLQVIAKGFQTYGQDFKIDKADGNGPRDQAEAAGRTVFHLQKARSRRRRRQGRGI